MSPAPVRLVVFDLGGVLVKICRSWSEACARAGIDVRAVSDLEEDRVRRAAVVRAFDLGALDEASFSRALSDAMDGLYAPEEVARVHAAWLVGEYAGVPRIFDTLEKRGGLSAGLLSNTNEAHWRRMVPGPGLPSPEFPSLHRAEHPHASHRLGVAKPERAAFERFEALTGRHGAEIVFFDDLEANVSAARAAGWRAEVIDPAGDPPAQVLAHLRALGVL